MEVLIDYAKSIAPIFIAIAYVYTRNRKLGAAIRKAEADQSIKLAHEWQDSYGVIKKEFDDYKKDSNARFQRLEKTMSDMKTKHQAQRKDYEATIKGLKKENKELHGQIAKLQKVASFMGGLDKMEH